MRFGFFTQEFLESLPDSTNQALVKIAQEFVRYVEAEPDTSKFNAECFPDYVEAVAILSAFAKARGIDVSLPTIGKGSNGDMANIHTFFQESLKKWSHDADRDVATAVFSEKQDEYASLFDKRGAYEFSDTEMQNIQDIINALRVMISESNLITADHKRRLLRRLEAMQRELHKRTSDIDRFWGFVAEAGIVTRKFGEDLKPISDRVTELGKIVIGVIMAKEGIKALPDITKLLGP
jgi:hypothetical protein